MGREINLFPSCRRKVSNEGCVRSYEKLTEIVYDTVDGFASFIAKKVRYFRRCNYLQSLS